MKVETRNVGRGRWTAELGDVRADGATATEAREAVERQVLSALVWQPPVVEVTPTVVLVAYQNLGRYGYDVFDVVSGARRVSISTGESFAEAVDAMRRHAVQYRADSLACAS